MKRLGVAIASLGRCHFAELFVEAALVQVRGHVTLVQLEGPAIRGGGLGEPPLLLQCKAQVVVRHGERGIEFDHALPASQGGRVVFASVMGVGQVLPDRAIVRGQLDRVAKAGKGGGVVALEEQGQTAVGIDLGHLRGRPRCLASQPQGHFVGSPRLAEALQGTVGVAEIVVGGRQVALERDGFRAMREAFLGFALFDQQLAQVAACHRQLGIEIDRQAVSLEGFAQRAQLAEGRTEVVPGQGEIGPHLQGGAELGHGFGKPP